MRRRNFLAFLPHNQGKPEAAQAEQEAASAASVHVEDADELDRDALAAEYERIFDKKPGNMKPETIAARIAEHGDAE